MEEIEKLKNDSTFFFSTCKRKLVMSEHGQTNFSQDRNSTDGRISCNTLPRLT